MQHIDEKFKDATPQATVARIQKILSENGIEVQEKHVDSHVPSCYSLRLSIVGTGMATNGKGATPDLARASAYAELMERLQSDHLGNRNLYTDFADIQRFGKEELIQFCGFLFEAIAKSNPKADGSLLSVDEIADACTLLEKSDTAKVIPYFNATTGEMIYFPLPLTKIYSTTGLAAGNTTEEALVQGLSEIFERHCKLRLMNEKLIPPTVPDDYLRQYPQTYATIEAIRNAGYDVIVKDCSLETPFPVLATILVDKRTHAYHVHLGCHPIFEIALRRTLTETFQGRTLENVASVSTIVSAKNYKVTIAELSKNMVTSSGTYPAEFFLNSNEAFKPHKNRTNMNNNEMLGEIMDYLKSNGYNVLIRDHSSLGFPTYRIIIPGFCEVFPFLMTAGALEMTLSMFYDSTPGTYTNISKEKASICLKLLEQKYKNYSKFGFSEAFAVPIKLSKKTNGALLYLNMAYLEWAVGNTSKAAKHLEAARHQDSEYDSDYLHCLSTLLNFSEDYQKSYELLSTFYYDDTLNEVKAAIDSGNPFKKYAHACAETDCENCKYKDICLKKENLHIRRRVNAAINAFDDAAALEELKNFFAKL